MVAAKPMLETRALVPSGSVGSRIYVRGIVREHSLGPPPGPRARCHRAPSADRAGTTKIANPSAVHRRQTQQEHSTGPLRRTKFSEQAQASSSGTPACLSPRQPPSTVETIRRGRIVCTQSRSSSKDECSE